MDQATLRPTLGQSAQDMALGSTKVLRCRNVLVAGGAGYLGSVLVPRLIGEGYSVVVLDRFFFGETLTKIDLAQSGSLRLVRGDIRDVDASLLEGIDSVIDLCGISNDPSCDLDPQMTWAINVEGASRLASLSLEAGVRRYIYASSCSVYGSAENLKMTEDMPCIPQTLYAASKLHIEQKLIEKSLQAQGTFEPVVLRLATLFGVSPRMRFDLALNTMTKCAFVEGTIKVDGDGSQWRPFLHVNDAASAFIAALEVSSARIARNKIFNVGAQENNRQIRQLALDVQAQMRAANISYSGERKDARDYSVDFSLSETDLEFKPLTTIDNGVREVIQALLLGNVDPADSRSNTVQHYQTLFGKYHIEDRAPSDSAAEASLVW